MEQVLAWMRERAGRFNVDKVRQEDLASARGAPDMEEWRRCPFRPAPVVSLSLSVEFVRGIARTPLEEESK